MNRLGLLLFVLVAAACGVVNDVAVATSPQRIQYLQLIAPEFRGNRAVEQLVDYRLASHAFPGRLGEMGVLPPDRLSNPATFTNVGGRVLLPASFATSVRDGYRFTFDGIRCDIPPKIVKAAGMLCAGYVYWAVSTDAAPSPQLAFALFSEDDRIHMRTDGARPTRDDPIADNTAPSSAAEIADLPATLHEQIALSDLRQFLAAERIYYTMETRGFVSPDMLADGRSYVSPPAAPLVDAYFAQPLRLGYRFTFTGETPSPFTGAQAGGPVYETWSYSAVPVEPGPSGRHSFFIGSEGGIHVADGNRAATRSDPFLSAK